MSSDEDDNNDIIVSKNVIDVQRMKIEKLMKNPNKPAFIPEKPAEKLPRAFNPPEIVRNIWGSSAGAGSGDFHVYRGIRRREFARQKYLDELSVKESRDKEFIERLEIHKKEAEERTAKKRAKRLKKKQKEKRNKEVKKAKVEGQDNHNGVVTDDAHNADSEDEDDDDDVKE